MKNVKRVMRAFVGILLIVLAIIVWNKHYAQYRNVEEARKIEQELNALPDYDYVSEIKSLIDEKRYGEAIVLCEDVQKLELPCAPEVAALKTEAEKESKSVWNRLKKAADAFITGNSDGSAEEILANIASDMFLYGDVRDLVKQGWFKITGKETDPLLATLAGVGIVTELVDIGDWLPAVFKAFRKIGAVSAKMADSLVAMFKNVVKTKKLDKGTKAFFGNMKKMKDSAGLIRTKNMFKYADNAGDLAVLAKKSAANPSLTHLVAKHAGNQTVDVVKGATPDFLKLVARKGRLAVRFMKVYHKHHAVIEKTFWQKIPKGLVNGFSAVSGLIGLILLLAGAVPLFANKRK